MRMRALARTRVRAGARARLRALGRDTPYLEVRYAVSLPETRRISFGTPCWVRMKSTRVTPLWNLLLMKKGGGVVRCYTAQENGVRGYDKL